MSLKELLPFLDSNYESMLTNALECQAKMRKLEDVFGLFDEDLMEELIKLSGN